MATSTFIHPIFLSLFFSVFIPATTSVQETDILLTFKATIEDPKDTLSTWSNTSNTHLCNWTGVTCSSTTLSPSVTSLNLQGLNLSGEVSPSICQLPMLSHLNLADNNFNQPIPLHLSQCNSLESLNLSYNLIWGTIPDQISLFTSLKVLDLSKNHVEGLVPSGLGSLINLQVLNLGSNLFSGSIPSAIFSNLSQLVVLDLSENEFLVSEIPEEIGKLEKLEQLYLQRSKLNGYIPDSFVGLYGLKVLDLSKNNLTGEIPLKLGLSLEKLTSLDVSQNLISGSFPIGICNGRGLINLNLHTNLFDGWIPDTFEECMNLERFEVQNNGFSGDFPSGVWALPKLKIIRAENNIFNGQIPDSISMATQLEQVQIDNNSFTGRVPNGLGLLRSLYRFSASLNSLYGYLPQNFCDSPLMSILNLSHNTLSGNIPEFKKCRKLVSLSLANNSLSGVIPTSLADLPVLTYLDLSNNNLSGSIPPELQNLKLALLNVSFNQLSGKVPFALISGLPASFLEGNPGLCGPGLPNSCPDETLKHPSIHPSKLIFTLITITLAAGVIIVAVGFFIMCKSSFSKEKRLPDDWKMVLYYPLRITEHDLLEAVNEKSALSEEGTFGRVHVMKLPSGEFLVVKKIMNSGSLSSKSLKAEIKTLAKIRHKNITKLLGFCYSDESTLLIYEFLQNGSLKDAMSRSDIHLEWSHRLRIALGAAQGLAYLHKDYVPHLFHRNLKASNVLLDKDFEPKLTDFSLDRIVGENSYQLSVASELGSCCYIAPEHEYSKKGTEQMDVYSFGVVLLELLTGKKVVEEEESGESIDVVKWVRRKINMIDGAYQVLDPKISDSCKQEMLSALETALSCTSVVPEKRPTMLEVVRSLHDLHSRMEFSGVQIEVNQ